MHMNIAKLNITVLVINCNAKILSTQFVQYNQNDPGHPSFPEEKCIRQSLRLAQDYQYTQFGYVFLQELNSEATWLAFC